MKPVEQVAGECMQACIASILEVERDAVLSYASHISMVENGDIYTWLYLALREHDHKYTEFKAADILANPGWLPGYSMAIGYAPHTMVHACVALGNKVVHDPHESKAGLLKIRWFIELMPTEGK